VLLARSSSADQREIFETLDVQTRATQRYGGQAGRRTKPVWLDAEQAVAFTKVRSNTEVVLRIGRGTGAPAEDAVTDLRSPYLAISADGQQVAFMSQVNRGQPRALTVRQGRQVRALARTMPTQEAEQTTVQLDEWQALRAAWRPDGKQIAFYNKTSFSLIDTTTGEVCSVDLGGDSSGRRWALKASWSPDGRFLAALTSIGGAKGQVPFVDITVLDTATGTLRYLTLDVQHIYEFAWLPTSRQIAALGQLDRASEYANPSLFSLMSVPATFSMSCPITRSARGSTVLRVADSPLRRMGSTSRSSARNPKRIASASSQFSLVYSNALGGTSPMLSVSAHAFIAPCTHWWSDYGLESASTSGT
jgi:Tol biopolymer transport system component